MAYFLALDAGTTSNRALIFDESGQVVSMAQKEFPQYFPQPGWVEQNPIDIYSTMSGVAAEALAKASLGAEDLESIGITNQRETTILWDRKTGLPVHNAIVWQCRRTAPLADALKEAGYVDMILEKTGLVVDAYFSATKIKYLLDKIPGLRDRAKKGEIAFGTVDSYLMYQLSEGQIHKTDVSNACRTMLFNIHSKTWDQELLDLLDIPREILPEVCSSAGYFGSTSSSFLGHSLPITGVLGDQQAALFGQSCLEAGEAKATYGTGAFVLMNTGPDPIISKNGLLTSIAWDIKGQTSYALEGSIFVAGSAVQWLRDQMGFMAHSEESEEMALSVPDTNGAIVVPAFTGLGAPYWNPYCRGSIFGLSRGVNKNHLVRATLESIAYLTHDVVQAMQEDSGLKRKLLKVDGGASNNNFLMQTQADLLQIPVLRPQCTETTALGAFLMAGLGSGYFKNLADTKKIWQKDREFLPGLSPEQREMGLDRWHKAVNHCLNFNL